MSTVRVDPHTMNIEISGELMDRFYAACRFASTQPSLVVTQLVEHFVEGEETKQEARDGQLNFWEFSRRRSQELWDKMKHRIDYDNAPSGGPKSLYQQELRLEKEIEQIIEDEWQRIEQS